MLSRPYLIDGQVALVGASIGLALAPADAAEPDALISCADFGLYAAKAAGRGALRRFEPVMRERAEARRSLEQELRAALPLGQLELYYQPQVALAETHLTGFEALLRWRHPGRGIIPPDLFLPLAAEAGLMPSLSAWVLREACLAAMRWPSPLRVAVNVAPIDLEAGALLGQVRRALAGSGLPPHRLELEITETSLLHPTQAVLSQLRELREMGVQISLDDFGTGFSSLTQLRSFPFDRIKLDRSFADDGAVVEAVARLGAALGMRTTAEGVETAEQLLRMREGGCTEAQGYLIGRPVPQAELPALIRHWQEHAAPGTALQRSDAA
jgi:predicted signal transduction protein with EAL and GGDEF domain